MSIEKLKKIINDAKRIVFFGGAGVSTGSGIPDFRGTGGLYSTGTQEYGVRPETILSARFMYNNPELFYRYYRENMIYEGAKPNGAHYALVRLEREGKLTSVITQNIDGLHQLAGSERVIELHGTTLTNRCIDCGEEYPLEYITATDGVPECKYCGALVRPNVVLYGEPLAPAPFYEAQGEIMAADVLIVGGTSLTVTPAADLVDDFHGKHFVIINKTPTPYDHKATLIIREPIADVLEEALK